MMHTIRCSSCLLGGRECLPGVSGQGGFCLGECLHGGCLFRELSAQKGCLPRRGVCPGGVCQEGSAQVGVCPSGCLPRWVSAQGGICPGGLFPGGCLPRGLFAQGGVCLRGCLQRGLSACGDAQTPVNRMTDRQVERQHGLFSAISGVTMSFTIHALDPQT